MILLEMYGSTAPLPSTRSRISKSIRYMKTLQLLLLMVGTIWSKEVVLLVPEIKHLNMLDMLSEDISINSQDSDMWSLRTLCGQKKYWIRLMK